MEGKRQKEPVQTLEELTEMLMSEKEKNMVLQADLQHMKDSFSKFQKEFNDLKRKVNSDIAVDHELDDALTAWLEARTRGLAEAATETQRPPICSIEAGDDIESMAILNALLRGARPAAYKDPYVFRESMLQVRALALSNPRLHALFQKTMRNAPSSPLMFEPMQMVLEDCRMLESAARYPTSRMVRTLCFHSIDNGLDIYMVVCYFRGGQFWYLSCALAGVVGNIALSAWACSRMGIETGPTFFAKHVCSLGLYGPALVANSLMLDHSQTNWWAMMIVKRGEIFEAALSVTPNIYSMMIAGCVQGFHALSNAQSYIQLTSFLSSLVVLAFAAHVHDKFIAYIQCDGNATCRRLLSGPLTVFLAMTYRFGEMCAFANGIVLGALTRPYGVFVFAFVRLASVFILAACFKKEDLITWVVRISHFTICNLFAFRTEQPTLASFAKHLRNWRLFEACVVSVGTLWIFSRDSKWRDDVVHSGAWWTSFLILVSVIGSFVFIICHLLLWSLGAFERHYELEGSSDERYSRASQHERIETTDEPLLPDSEEEPEVQRCSSTLSDRAMLVLKPSKSLHRLGSIEEGFAGA